MSPLHPEIWVYWGPRQESARVCAARLAHMFEDLRTIDPLFAKWNLGRRKDVWSTELNGLDELTQRFEKGKHYTDVPRRPIPDLGYRIGAWNGRRRGEDLGLQIGAGDWTTHRSFSNDVSIEQDWFCNEPFPLTSSEIFAAVLRAMVTAWDADWGRVSDRNYKNATVNPLQGHPPPFWSGWIIYLASRFADHVVPPPQAGMEKVPGHGMMIYATRETFDLDNPAHIAAADAIQASLAPIQGMVQNRLISPDHE